MKVYCKDCTYYTEAGRYGYCDLHKQAGTMTQSDEQQMRSKTCTACKENFRSIEEGMSKENYYTVKQLKLLAEGLYSRLEGDIGIITMYGNKFTSVDYVKFIIQEELSKRVADMEK